MLYVKFECYILRASACFRAWITRCPANHRFCLVFRTFLSEWWIFVHFLRSNSKSPASVSASGVPCYTRPAQLSLLCRREVKTLQDVAATSMGQSNRARVCEQGVVLHFQNGMSVDAVVVRAFKTHVEASARTWLFAFFRSLAPIHFAPASSPTPRDGQAAS